MVFLRAKKIAFYQAADGEISPAPLMETALHLGKECYLPVLPDGLRPRPFTRLLFQRFDPTLDRLAINRYGILEPAYDPRYVAASRMLDLILVPLVAFDRCGNRLGMGKGYYDRTLAGIQGQWKRPALLGLAHSIQESPDLITKPWDIPMDGIVTEREIIWTGKQTPSKAKRLPHGTHRNTQSKKDKQE